MDWSIDVSVQDYSSLKKMVKRGTADGTWDEQDEARFKALLESELEKVYQFQKDKVRAAPISRWIRSR